MKKESVFIPRLQDLQILEKIHMFRFIPLKVLSEILINEGFYTKYQAVARSIKRLESQNLVRPVKYGLSAKVLFLSRKGAKTLSVGFGIPIDSINCPERLTGVNYFAIEHTIKVAELYLLFSKECQKHNLELLDFRGDHSIKYEYQFRIDSYGKKISRYVMPDAVFKIKSANETKWFFVEYDRGTEYSKDVAIKYTKYFQYYIYDKRWLERFGEFPTVLFITETSSKRLENLLRKEAVKMENHWFPDREKEKVKNVVIKGVMMHENLNSTSSSKLQDFLIPERFLFIDYETLQKEGLETKWLDYEQNQRTLLEGSLKVQ